MNIIDFVFICILSVIVILIVIIIIRSKKHGRNVCDRCSQRQNCHDKQCNKTKKKKRNAGSVIMIIFLGIAAIAVSLILSVYHGYPLQYTSIINKYAEEYELAPELICAVIHAESRFNKDAVSYIGATGLMQIIDSTAYWIAHKMEISGFRYDDVLDPEVNIRFGCYYLNALESQYGDINTALCAYNAGSGNVDEWLSEPEYSDDGKTLKYIPFPETREYVKQITNTRRVYPLLLALDKIFKYAEE